MRGFPKRFNTRQDVLNTLADYPQETAGHLRRMVDERFNWFIDRELAEGEAGVSDDTHRVREDKDDEGAVTARYQEAWREDPRAQLFRLGLTVDEAEQLIEETTR
ncbi:MAG: hypothetical protein U5L08_04450 [Xanthomonadales bacterium]|nr:hypothetical protein [Xanthomonadales bacterium]